MAIVLAGFWLTITAVDVSAGESEAGWRTLFDGTSLEQWRSYGKGDPDPRWQIEEGVLMLTGRGGGDLITREQFDNFDLRLEWKISEGGNSGVFILADESERPIFVHAPEIQILDNERHADREWASHRSGSLYDLIEAPPQSQRPAGEWNTLRIVHVAGHLQVWQNGVATADIVIGGEQWNALVAKSKFADWTGFGQLPGGHIGLQDHGDPVYFRNVSILPVSVSP